MIRSPCGVLWTISLLLAAGCHTSGGGLGDVLVNATVWAVSLPLEEAGVIKPAPGYRPARDYFLGYRVTVFDGRKMYRKEEKGRTVCGVADTDGGRSTVNIDNATKKKTFHSTAPGGGTRPIPKDSLTFLNKYAH